MLDRPSDQNHYQVLEISEAATAEEVQGAYQRAREIYGSDSVVSSSILTPEERREILERVTEAYHTLIAGESRRLYDRSLAERTRSSGEAETPGTESYPRFIAGTSPSPSPSYPRLVEIPSRSAETSDRPKVTLGVKEEASGAFLRKAREAAGVDLRSISQETKIGVTMLGYIEEERLDRLPAAVYLKNFVQQYARFLGLEDERVARSYLARIRRLQSQSGDR